MERWSNSCAGPEGSRFQVMKATRLSALCTCRLYPPRNTPGTHFCLRMSRSHGHSAAGRIKTTKNSNYTMGNRTRYLPACSAVPQATETPRDKSVIQLKIIHSSQHVGRDRAVRTTTRYGSNAAGGRVFPHPSRPDPVAHQPTLQEVPGLFARNKAAGAWRWPPTPYLALRLKEELTCNSNPPLGLHVLV
jgi:hypothetical protein